MNMNAARMLHDAARRYCIERHGHWCGEYQKLMDQDRARIGSGYSDQAYDTFPRYHALAAILAEIERIDAEKLPVEAELHELLIIAGHTAESIFTKDTSSEIGAAAIADERQAFEETIQGFSQEDLERVEPLPYRRVLSADEVTALWPRVTERWGADGSYYFPLGDKSDPSLQAFSTEAFDNHFSPATLREILRSKGVTRVFELREYGDENYVLDIDSWEPYYSGAEGFWFSEDLDWIMYCSHESSTSVGGTLADAILADWAEAKNHEWALTLNG